MIEMDLDFWHLWAILTNMSKFQVSLYMEN